MWEIFRQGIYALRELEERGIQHWDIKPDNLFIDFRWNTRKEEIKKSGYLEFSNDDYFKLVFLDFGESAQILSIKEIETKASRGNFVFRAPEQFKNPHSCPKADVWAFGCLILWMLTPIEDNTTMTYYKAGQEWMHKEIRKVLSRPEDWALKEMLRLMIVEDPAERPSAKMIA